MSAIAELNRGQVGSARVPPLVAGDHLTRDEFERRYHAMPHVKKAELIEGIVYMPSPVSFEGHAAPHASFIGWLIHYTAYTSGVRAGDNGTLRLDLDNEPQPDAFLRIHEKCGGQSKVVHDYVEGAPELVAEVAASSASYDLHEKLNAYRRNGVKEYLVWRVWDGAIDWFVVAGGRYETMTPNSEGQLRSREFPGLWLDPAALLRDDMATVLNVVRQGIESPEHAEFVSRLERQQAGNQTEKQR
jgi:Uma2 family endonuclease